MKRFLSVLISVLAFVFFTSGYVYAKQPIVFVHGFSGVDQLNFPYLYTCFYNDGWPSSWLYMYTYNSTNGVANAANVLKSKVNDCLAKTGQSKVDIVAHSMGGLVARYYITKLGGSAKVRHLVTLGAPHHGTDWAYACFFQSCYDMRPNSALINSLGGQGCNISLWSCCDEVIIPNSSAQCGTSVAIGCYGHLSMLASWSVYTKARAYLW